MLSELKPPIVELAPSQRSSMNLAIAFSETERILLVSARGFRTKLNQRAPGMHRHHNTESETRG